ncbi:MAG TPA: DNA polymerase III subunit delta' [Terriglobales bacterium]
MGFVDFHGNQETVRRIREMLGRDRFPHAVIISGPEGAGKYTLAQMCAKTMNCLIRPVHDGLPDFCGECSNCVRIAAADNLDERFQEAVEAWETLREVDKKDTRILIQTHPEVMIIPPDPPQMLIKVGQVRRVIENIYFKPVEGRRKVYIFTESSFMKEAANALLKVLEEPPEFASLILLTTNPGELLPTIRSRCVSFTLAALPNEEIEAYLKNSRADLQPQQRKLVARLAEGAIGRAQRFDLAEYITARADALTLLRTAVQGNDHTALFKTTDSYRSGAEGKSKTENLIRTLYSLLEDLLVLKSSSEDLVRNIDIQSELVKLSGQISFDWVHSAANRLAQVESGMRRNLLRSLSLDALAIGLDQNDKTFGTVSNW